jgi:hypothetical protein
MPDAHTNPTKKEDLIAFDRGVVVERLTYTSAQVCLALQISQVTLWRLEKRGLLCSLPHLRHKRYSVAAVARFAAGQASS